MAAGETEQAKTEGREEHLIKDASFPFFNLSLTGTVLKGD